ncbi:origin recognition complex subunit 5 [Nasonia vitripennis]|uniref:Origin recognition complex subunit 5 n=1 Tax=Nasonia vitripennis TaxID=7425 RepID=A0A7M7Q2X6_NASVI|nr:origin recognition complex subunit 5 [Nasonia vitripennis]
MEKCVEVLGEEIKCRDSLIRTLYSLLRDDPMFQSLFIYGHVSCGKSLIVQSVLKYLDYNVSIINCVEHTNSRSLFEKIIVDLSSIKLSSSNGYKLERRCDDFVELIFQIKSIAKANPKPIVIVFERCDKLRDLHENILPGLLRLGELTQSNVCTIFTSDVIWEKYKPKTGMYDPITLHFPAYNKDETLEILLHTTKPVEYETTFYSTYLNLFLSVFYRFCRDLHELRYMAKKNFLKYIEPVENGLIAENDTNSLWRNISHTLRENLEVIYLRVSTNDFEQQNKLSLELESTARLALSFELPFYAKYLLIAAFLASYNPMKEDRRLFMKDAGPKKKRAYKRKNEKLVTNIREGPKNFPLNRMLAIFCSIIDEKIDMNAVLLTQIPSMCQLGLLTVVGDNNIDEPKYKCCINYEFAMVISKNVNFELQKYLYDYLH